jgi:hypothetical protein
MIRFKKLTNTVYVLVAALIIYNSFGYILLYFPTSALIKYFVGKSIKEKEVNAEELSILVFKISDLENNKHDFIWKRPDKEFRFNGKMYDIENKEVKGDSVYYKVYYDHKENILEELFSIHQQDNKKDKTQNSAQKVLLVGFYYEEINSINSKNIQNTSTNIPLKKNEADFLNHIFDVPTPPPRKIV